jgi:hypothetical protein
MGNMTEYAEGSLIVPRTPIMVSLQEVFSALIKPWEDRYSAAPKPFGGGGIEISKFVTGPSSVSGVPISL